MVYLFYIEIEGNVVQVHTGSTREPARLSWLGHLDKVDIARISSRGRAAVSKTGGYGFESYILHLVRNCGCDVLTHFNKK